MCREGGLRWQRMLLSACLMIACTIGGLAQAARPLNVEDALQLKRISWFSVRPDGNQIAVEISGSISLVSVLTGAAPVELGQGMHPIWSPNGAALAYYGRTGHTV